MKKIILILSLVIFSCASEDDAENFKDLEFNQQIMKLINDYRIKKGKSVLKSNNYLKSLCQEHNNYMDNKGEISNDNWSPGRTEALYAKFKTYEVAENVAYNYNSDPQDVVNQWISIPENNENLLGDFTHFYVATNKNKEGRVYYTNIFAKIK